MIKVDGVNVESFTFPGGERQVRLPNPQKTTNVEVSAFLYSSLDVMDLLLTVNALKQINRDRMIRLYVPYIPYMRQDRVCAPGEAFSAEMMADLLDRLEVDLLITCDVHSLEGERLLKQSRRQVTIFDQAWILEKYGQKALQGGPVILAPDFGARAKSVKVANKFGLAFEACDKKRNSDTGEIERIIVPDLSKYDGEILIVDDICDGGRTFIEIAKKLRDQGIYEDRLSLYVTHGIFSKGVMHPGEYFKHIYCFNAWPEVWRSVEKLTVFSEGGNDEITTSDSD